MKKETITVQLDNSLDATPAAMLVQVASKYDSSIYIESGTAKVNAKSIMGMMSLGLCRGEELVITAEGVDEQEAVRGVEQYLSGKAAS